MNSVALLSVLAITQTIVLARPTDTSTETKGSKEDMTNNSGQLQYKFPSDVTHGFTITINGTINTDDKELIVVFPTNKSEEHCQIIFNFEAKTVEISPAPSSEDSTTEYDLLQNTEGSEPSFSIKISARVLDGNHMFKLTLEGSSSISCPINSFEHFQEVIIKQGAKKVSSLLFEFNME